MTSLIFYIVAPTERVMRVIGQECENNWDWIFQSSFAADQQYEGESFRKVISHILWANKQQEQQLFSHTLFARLSEHSLHIFPLKLSYLFSFFLCHMVLFLLIINLYSKKSFPQNVSHLCSLCLCPLFNSPFYPHSFTVVLIPSVFP